GVLRRLGQMGKTIIVSSHILPELADICNKVGIIDRGVLNVNAEVSEVMRQVRQRTVLHVAVKNNLDGAMKILSAQPSVDQLEAKNGQAIVTLKQGIEDYSDLPTRLIESGHQLTLFREEEINLESAFMALTKGTGAKI
ncbi:MAG: multidrug ABC transporter ATP-binding protein, partial [Pirellulaceae bacterium]